MVGPTLTSGVIYDSQAPNVQRGIEAMYGALGQIAATKIRDEQGKRALYDELLNIGLEDIKGKYQDEAVAIKNDILKKTAKIFSETEGMPSAAQLREINAEKGRLTNYAKMYSGMEDWYRTASMTAAQIPSPRYREKTIANITDILSQPTLTQTWDKILSSQWLELPPAEIDIFDIRKNIIDNADKVNKPFEAVNADKYGNVSYESWQGSDPNQIIAGAEWAWNNIEGLKDKWPDLNSWINFIGTGREYKNTVRGKQKQGDGGGANKIPVVKFNPVTRKYEFADINKGQGIPLAAFSNFGNSQAFSDARIVELAPIDDKSNEPGMAKIVAPKMAKLSFDEIAKKTNSEFAQNILVMNPELLKGKTTKEPINLDTFWVPYYMVKSYTDRNIQLEVPDVKTDEDGDPAGLFE